MLGNQSDELWSIETLTGLHTTRLHNEDDDSSTNSSSDENGEVGVDEGHGGLLSSITKTFELQSQRFGATAPLGDYVDGEVKLAPSLTT